MTIHETAGEKLVPAQHKNLPNRILRAFDNAKHLKGLPRSARDTLAEICRFVPQADPLATVFARKSLIAERIGASERTVYRHLQLLLQHQLIEVLEQERKSRNGRFSVARIRLTAKAVEILGLAKTASEVIHNPPHDNMSDGHTLTEPTIPKNQRPKTENGLPEDLAWLSSQGISRAGVFKLMGKAKSKGKLLSDIALAVKSYLIDIKGARLYAYLAKLVDGPTDFSFAAAEERRRIAEREKIRHEAGKVHHFRERFKNTVLTNRKQDRLFFIDGAARFVQVLGKQSGTQPLNDVMPWIERIGSGELVLATLSMERRIRAEYRCGN
ncbi:hypothetical protein SAMN06265795_103335 [Noviherbaspirillum humi]|uniref:Uncharacterized protein n=1 Tax=Noviherbaspirillum humi TaxID=1688639 RepID=A0A239FHQ5_9BURK|nr:hypothetical protein [Noviherbaspirillum humi]SNS55594.1 hypothetical protein SAMN06265795_103335 [Noviherbaspirillum humi]